MADSSLHPTHPPIAIGTLADFSTPLSLTLRSPLKTLGFINLLYPRAAVTPCAGQCGARSDLGSFWAGTWRGACGGTSWLVHLAPVSGSIHLLSGKDSAGGGLVNEGHAQQLETIEGCEDEPRKCADPRDLRRGMGVGECKRGGRAGAKLSSS